MGSKLRRDMKLVWITAAVVLASFTLTQCKVWLIKTKETSSPSKVIKKTKATSVPNSVDTKDKKGLYNHGESYTIGKIGSDGQGKSNTKNVQGSKSYSETKTKNKKGFNNY